MYKYLYIKLYIYIYIYIYIYKTIPNENSFCELFTWRFFELKRIIFYDDNSLLLSKISIVNNDTKHFACIYLCVKSYFCV